MRDLELYPQGLEKGDRYIEEIKKTSINPQHLKESHQRMSSTPERYCAPVANQINKDTGHKSYAEFILYIASKEFSIQHNGYNKDEVDNFLDRICDTFDYYDGINMPRPIVSLLEINEKTFGFESMGYDCKEVDLLLEEIMNCFPNAERDQSVRNSNI